MLGASLTVVAGVTSALAGGEDLGTFTCRRLDIVMAIA